jgi:hypothetical protein
VLAGVLLVLALLVPRLGGADGEPDVPAGGSLFRDPLETAPNARPRSDSPRAADLALVWYDPSGALPDGFPALAAEVAAIFRRLGVEASWREGGVYGEAPIPEVPVILLGRQPAAARRSERVLGLVVPAQEPLRAVWVFQDNVRLALGLGTGSLGPRDVDALGRALGRVVAHEVIHAIAPEAPHASAGLMRHALSPDFLLRRRADVDSRCASAFKTRLAAGGLQARAQATLDGAR